MAERVARYKKTIAVNMGEGLLIPADEAFKATQSCDNVIDE